MSSRPTRRPLVVPRVSRALVALLRPTFGVWLRRRFRVTVREDEEVRTLRPPYVVLPNHVNFWDPFLVALALATPTHFVAADGNFRTTLMRRLMALAGAVPKTKAKNDLESIRALQALIATRKSIAIFAEGQRSWDGVGREILPGIEKLIRLLGAPVIAMRLRGAYLATPRWSRALRRGPVVIEKELLFTPADLKRLTIREIGERLRRAISVDEIAWQRETGHLYHSRKRAERIEWAIFHCPTCGTDGGIRSRGNRFWCEQCGETHYIAPSGTLYRVRSDKHDRLAPPHFPSVHAWNLHQLETLRHRMRTAVAERGNTPLLFVPECVYLNGHRSRALYHRGRVSLRLTHDRLLVEPMGRSFRLTEIHGIHVQYIEQLEFYAYGRLHVFRIRRPWDSAYRIEQSILELQRATKKTLLSK